MQDLAWLTFPRDSFVGGYVAQYLTQRARGEWNIEAAVQYGCRAAARVIESLGCLKPIPWSDEIGGDLTGDLENLELEVTLAGEAVVPDMPTINQIDVID